MTASGSKPGGVCTLLAGMLITVVLGSIHAFSVFIEPLELRLNVSRAAISAVYSLALMCLTIAVLLGYRWYALLTPAHSLSVVCGVAALGVIGAAFSQSLIALILSYSVLFGTANGIGYGYVLQLVAQALPRRSGFAMGTVTAVYAIGATLNAKAFAEIERHYGVDKAFFALAGLLIVLGGLASFLVRLAGSRYVSNERSSTLATTGASPKLLRLLWLGYGCGAGAGLMAMAHAAGLVAAVGGTREQWIGGAMLIGLGNAFGGFSAAVIADRLAPKRLLVVLPLLSLLALLGLIYRPEVTPVLLGLGLIGVAYGAIIAVYPYATVVYFGTGAAAKLYGRIFTAWGIAGLAAPWLAGYLYDLNGSYTPALWFAVGLGGVSAVSCALLPAQPDDSSSHSRIAVSS